MKLYTKAQLFNDTNGYAIITTPEGIQAVQNKVTGVVLYKNAKSQLPEYVGNTAYSASYVTKINAGMPRAVEKVAMLELPKGGEFAVYFTEGDKPATTQEIKTMMTQAVQALPLTFKKIAGKKGVLSVKDSHEELGFLEA